MRSGRSLSRNLLDPQIHPQTGRGEQPDQVADGERLNLPAQKV
jgi:hypothetical protein